MKDTSPRANQKIVEMMLQKAPEERLALGCSMFDFSKQLVTDSLKEETPSLSPASLRRELFLRFYGNDFDRTQQEKILSHLIRS